jgi:hypothetical protein
MTLEIRGYFEIVEEITQVETIAVGGKIRYIESLRRRFGAGEWRKLKGFTKVRLVGGTIRTAEVHWYEAHGIGKRLVKIKRFVD